MKVSSFQALLASVSLPAAYGVLCLKTGLQIPDGLEGDTHASWVARLEEAKRGNIPPPSEPTEEYADALATLDIEAVKADIKAAMTDSKDWWPADYGNYGPLFVRLAWHCSGTFRKTDGRGSCSGGRMRFEPERSWEDNTNLDKARRLLWPIKEKYGLGLSWGDLFVSAGTVSIEAMGGPTLGVCFGRVDDEDGARSIGLDDCDGENGDCQAPMGATTKELIYVNPEGPMGRPIPEQSAVQVRDTFARMGMNDRETVALIGGGHAFGKTHGACVADEAAGDSPRLAKEAGLNPHVQAWQGKCGSGFGAETSTSGFEGPWTYNPISWDNTYFTILNGHTWKNETGPGGKQQWHASDDTDLSGRGAVAGTRERVMMLTSDVSLLHDPANRYQGIVKEFAEDSSSLDKEFAAAWHKLTTSGWGKGKPRCTGDMPFGFVGNEEL